MKLFVFAHTPPPLHGQSAMVATLLEGLKGDTEIEVIHIDARLSRDGADIGSWRPGKLLALVRACRAARHARIQHGPGLFYYIPAPGKRGALYRDFVVMLLCRRRFSGLVLHWHAVGLGNWLRKKGTSVERWLARWLLGDADLSLILAPELADDPAAFGSRHVNVVPNCIPDPGAPAARKGRAAGGPVEVLFLGLCSRDKGVLDTIEAVALAEKTSPRSVRLTVAGSFPTPAEERIFQERVTALPPHLVCYEGLVEGARKQALYAAADVFCLPTSHPHEGQPLALIEALAHNVPIVTTRWRGIPSMLPKSAVWFVEPRQPVALAAALIAAGKSDVTDSSLRAHYEAHFTCDQHIRSLKAALLSVAK